MKKARTLAMAALTAGAPLAAARAQDQPAGYERTTPMVPMRDGVRLNTVIWTPKSQSGPLAVLLERTPYDAEGTCRGIFMGYKAIVSEGYILVCQDLRGKYGSEGTFSMIRP